MIFTLASTCSQGAKRVALMSTVLCLVIGVTSALTGCALGPNFKAPKTQTTAEWLAKDDATAPDISLPQGQSGPVAQWWRGYQSEELNKLVELALVANPNISLMHANWQQAVALERQSLANLLPSVSSSINASRNRDAVNVLSPALNSGAPVYGLYSGQLNVGFTLDVFGQNRRALEAARAYRDASEWQFEAERLLVSGSVVATAVQLAALNEQVKLLKHSVFLGEQMLVIQQRAQQSGLVSTLELSQEQVNLAGLRTQAVQVQLKAGTTRDLLAVYLGKLANDSMTMSLNIDALTVPTTVPLGVPSELVNQRPDVKAAEALLHQATANVGVAYASLLPSINLVGLVGSTNTLWPQLFKTNASYWSGQASLSQVWFEGGAGMARVKGAKAALDAAGAQYRLSVLTAFQNVVDGLKTVLVDQQSLTEANTICEAQSRQASLIEQQTSLGEASKYQALSARQNADLACVAMVAAKANLISDHALLQIAVSGKLPKPE